MLRECRGVNYHEVIPAVFEGTQIILDVGTKLGVLRETVQIQVPGCQFNCPGRGIDAVDMKRSAAEGINRESTGIAEKVEYVAPLGIPFHQGPVLALVKEETRLLALRPIHYEFVSVLRNYSLPFYVTV